MVDDMKEKKAAKFFFERGLFVSVLTGHTPHKQRAGHGQSNDQ